MRFFHRILAGAVLLLAGCIATAAQGTKYEAENGTLTGSISVQSSASGYSGTGYVGIFQDEGDRVTVSFALTQGAWHKIYIG